MFNLNRLAPETGMVSESTLSLNESFANNDRHDHSYMTEALEFLTTIDNEMLEANRVFYGALCESEGNDMLIIESFSDWMDTFKKIIKKVVDFLKALLNKFLVGINMLIKREKYLKNHKKDFNKFNENHKFHMNVFKFTINDGAGANVPPMGAIYNTLSSTGRLTLDATSGLNNIMDNNLNAAYEADKAKGFKKDGENSFDIDKAYDEYIKALEDTSYYDKVRAYMLGDTTGNKRVDASDYSKDLFEVFRDGQSGKEDHEFEQQDITEAYTRFDAYERVKKDLEKRKKEAEKDYDNLAKDVSKAVEVLKDGKFKVKGGAEVTVSSEAKARKYEYYMKARANEVNEVASIHTIAFSARLDAYKDQFNQDKTILYKALYRILGNIKTGVRED